jgi:MFS family permease
VGDGLRLVAFPLLAASITRDPGLVAGLTVALRVPWLLFSLPAGAVIDRLDRRQLMAVANLVRAGAVGALSVAILLNRGSLLYLYVVAFVVGTGEVLFDTTAQALIPATVERQHLERANGRLFSTELIGNELVGPLVGSFLFVMAVGLPFMTSAVAYLVASFLLFGMKGSYRPVRSQEDEAPRRVLDGLRYIFSDSVLGVLTIFGAVWNFVVGAVSGVLVLFALEILGLSDVGFGMLVAAEAVGGIIGASLAPRVSRRFGQGRAILVAASLQGFGFSVAGLLSNPWWAGPVLAFAQASALVCAVVLVSLRQSIVPDHLLGRATAAMRVIAIGCMPLGAIVGGLLASQFGLRVPLLIAAPLMTGTALISARLFNNRTVAARIRPS